ncbi:M23 family metallopeptidase [Roseovarius faecimaris]|uniref:M23 family metallopeptidase n=1 Tax=Roseovarius faecimaris TaxID=2494550 RepID=A0A6I6IKI5_9RHOB|nr:M23 family metallopeptidase [Roseovarius faecimaris]QGX97379.1 M23 family metallopeptidase [Roseovarius faecimaris]
MRAPLFIAALAMTTQAAPAGPPELVWPLDCVQGQTCYIEDYVDADPGPGQADYTCGLKSRDGHRGTDIVLRDFAMISAGVAVRAAAPGVVSAMRDGMEDVAVTAETRAEISKQGCGNAVRIDHGDGWQTLYCHLKKGSVAVRSGDRVDAGQQIGLVGLSGLTNIPHLHIGVLRDGVVIDPFAPEHTTRCGAPDGPGLWAETPIYHQTGFITAGMATGVPSFDAVKSGAARADTAHPSEPLVLYGHFHHAQTGDVLTLSADGPEGEIFSHSEVLKSPNASQFKAFGRKAPPGGWPEGAYRGIARLTRAGELIAWRHADIEVTSQ